MQTSLTIIVPSFNEAASLPKLIDELIAFTHKNNYAVIIVDDASTDETKEILAKEYSKTKINFIRHKVNKGYGGAIKTGILAAKTKYCITIDADGQHSVSDIEQLHSVIVSKDADMVVGGRKDTKENVYRKVGKSIIRLFARMLMKINITDLNSGMKIYDTELAKMYLKLCPNSMAYSDVIALVFINQNHLVIEEPITVKERTGGKSTISTRTAIETIGEILNIVVLFNPMKIFFPVAFFCVAFGISWGLPFLVAGEGLSVAAMFSLTTGVLFFFLGLLAEQLSLIRKNSL